MRSHIILTLLPFVPAVLASASSSWNSVCGKTPPEAETTVDGQKFQYICHERHGGTVPTETGNFDHPDDCARLIVSRPEELIVWMVSKNTGNGQCRILQQDDTKPWTKNDILVMKKVDDSDEDLDDDDPTQELQDCKAALQNCQAGSSGGTSTPECMSLLPILFDSNQNGRADVAF